MPKMVTGTRLLGVSFTKFNPVTLDKELQARGFFPAEVNTYNPRIICWASPYDPSLVSLSSIRGELLFRDNWQGGATQFYKSEAELLADLG
jgi:hypothetical protein